jgi:hypothetical protein
MNLDQLRPQGPQITKGVRYRAKPYLIRTEHMVRGQWEWAIVLLLVSTSPLEAVALLARESVMPDGVTGQEVGKNGRTHIWWAPGAIHRHAPLDSGFR